MYNILIWYCSLFYINISKSNKDNFNFKLTYVKKILMHRHSSMICGYIRLFKIWSYFDTFLSLGQNYNKLNMKGTTICIFQQLTNSHMGEYFNINI